VAGPLELVEVGRVVRAHGLRGEVVVSPHGGCTEALVRLERVYLRRHGGKPKPWRVACARVHSGRVLLALEGMAGRDQAQLWREGAVLARCRDIAAVDPDRWQALLWLGRSVRTEEGRSVGVLAGVDYVAHQQMWRIRTEVGAVYVVPAALLRAISEDTLVMEFPPGLLDMCREDAPCASPW